MVAWVIVFLLLLWPVVFIGRLYKSLYGRSSWEDLGSILTGKGLPELGEDWDGRFNTHWRAGGSDKEDGV